MFESLQEKLNSDQAIRYTVTRDDQAVTYGQALDLWQNDAGFREFFNQLLADCPFAAFRWETPPLTRNSLGQPFQFVLLDFTSSSFQQADERAYRDYFTTDDSEFGIIAFSNLSGDATLVVPSPRMDNQAYVHLASFVRAAPQTQLDAIWKVVSRNVRAKLSDQPLWLSTAGGGVAWLHIRIDKYPKYYWHKPFKQVT